MGDKDSHEHGENHQGDPQAQAPRLQLATWAVAVREERPPTVLEKGFLQNLNGSKEGKRVGQQRLGHQEDVHHSPDGGGQVVRDDLFGGVCPSQVGHQGEEALEDAGCDVTPLQHAVELAGLLHVSLQRGQEDLGGVAEHDDADGNGEFLHVDVKLHFFPGPLSSPGEAVGNHHHVDDEVRQGAEQAELGHGLQVPEEGARQKRDRGHHRPSFLWNRKAWEAVVHEVTADHDVENARHDQLDNLSHVHNVATQRGETRGAAGVGDVHVWVPHSLFDSVLVFLIQTCDEDFAGVAAHHRRKNNEEKTEIAAVEDGVRQAEDEHALRTERRSWAVMDEAHIAVTGRHRHAQPQPTRT